MKIVITTVQAPFITGGAEFLANNLKAALEKKKHEVAIITMPFMDSPVDKITEHIVASRLLDAENTWAGKTDLCIALKFPAYFIPHSNKVVWALHQHRAAYDLFDSDYSNIKNNTEGNFVREVIRNADKKYLSEAKRIYTISDNVTKRMKTYTDINATTLYHPCPDMELFHEGKTENYILMPSRINVTKRQMLAVEAMKYVKSDVKLYIVGKADNPYESARLHQFVKDNKLEGRIKFFDFVSQDEKIDLYANCLAVLFIPLDEDYGYITLEAMASSKAVITANDSGGPLEFIDDGESGYIAKPEPRDLAKKIDRIAESKENARKIGKNAKNKLTRMNISWDNVIQELIGK